MSAFGFETTVEQVAETLSPRIAGRVFLVTGTSAGGMGAIAAIGLARASPAHIILVARTKAKVDAVVDDIAKISPSTRVTFVPCELSDQDSVRAAAAQILNDAAVSHIDAVINNAGVMAIPEYTVDKHGNEMQLSANHIGHFLLTNLIMPKILAAGPGARIVNVTSIGHHISDFRFDNYNFLPAGAGYDRWTAYGQSKTANILFSTALARRLADRGINAYAVHPGLILETNLGQHIDAFDPAELEVIARRNTGRPFGEEVPKSASQGAATMMVAALDPALQDRSGAYIVNCAVSEAYDYAVDPEAAEKLWTISEKLVGEQFDL